MDHACTAEVSRFMSLSIGETLRLMVGLFLLAAITVGCSSPPTSSELSELPDQEEASVAIERPQGGADLASEALPEAEASTEDDSFELLSPLPWLRLEVPRGEWEMEEYSGSFMIVNADEDLSVSAEVSYLGLDWQYDEDIWDAGDMDRSLLALVESDLPDAADDGIEEIVLLPDEVLVAGADEAVVFVAAFEYAPASEVPEGGSSASSGPAVDGIAHIGRLVAIVDQYVLLVAVFMDPAYKTNSPAHDIEAMLRSVDLDREALLVYAGRL